MDSDNDSAFTGDDTLSPSEALDSDEIRNDDGDIVVDPPERWIEAEEHHSLDEQLAAEVPDVQPDEDLPDNRPTRQNRGQIDGTPEDGDSFFTVVDDDEHQAVPGDDEADTIIED
ncbi:hypothetical protein [Mycolicibacterium parafortuitum]|uniref:DUF5709 domain-containing protein n=1 Tax=Mycolicibacterium parafortuitum TaxID=39692 RepID=A0A375YCE8_MYCPF|nr:hypothetical protein [Mycolicibacterium parafortuitum]ORB30781.1 hypothetical protein BST38_08555 [Mycolicibacterium parafortuitum]SRX78793.1 hypothetical protein MPP7335_00522 [Mycolicibacterium parafortuitum]